MSQEDGTYRPAFQVGNIDGTWFWVCTDCGEKVSPENFGQHLEDWLFRENQ